MIAPAMRSEGTSESVDPSAVNKRVPSVSPSDCPASTTRTSSPGMRLKRLTMAARASSVWRMRSPKFWLGLLSTTTTATELSGSRSSRVSEGLASASTMSAMPTARIAAPGLRDTKSSKVRTQAAANAAQRIWTLTRGANATPKFTFVLLLPEPFKQRRHVHLVGLVVAGERVHHDVDAGAECDFALARLAFDHRQHGLAVGLHSPGAGEIVGGDDDRGDAVAGADRPAGSLFFVTGCRQRFDPKLAGIEAAGEVAQQVERLGEDVVAWHRLKLWDVER